MRMSETLDCTVRFRHGGERETEAMRLPRGLRIMDVRNHYELVSLHVPDVGHLDQIAMLKEQKCGRELYLAC